VTLRTPAWTLGIALTVAAFLVAGPGDAPPGGDDWKYDTVHLKSGRSKPGLVLERTDDRILLRKVVRKPGAPTLLFTESFKTADVDHLDLLDDADREELSKRLRALVRERETLDAQLRLLDPDAAKGEVASGDALELKAAAWPADPKTKALTYSSTYFRLTSPAREEVVRLAAIHLEQVYAAYSRVLPPRVAGAQPATVLLCPSAADYQALVREGGRNLFNPALFDPAKNQIVCYSDVQRLADGLDKTRREAAKRLADLKDLEADLNKAYKGRIPPDQLAPIVETRKQVKAAEERNEEAFRTARKRLTQRLYHEAFHAYLTNYVYPPADGEAPRWLNEGLAQIFETAVVEVGELRIGLADADRLSAAQAAVEKGKLLPLADLLRAGPKQFQVNHAGEQEASDRYYLAAWALAFDLTFERKLLGAKALDDYVAALHKGADPLDAFRDLVGEPVAEFEKKHLQYLKDLRPDGTTAKK
jgi:hypothetical protein